MDHKRTEAVAERLFGYVNGGLAALVVYVGRQSGLLAALAREEGPCSARDLALRAGLSERYTQEWLLAMASMELVESEDDGKTFTLPREHAAVLSDEGSADFLGAFPGVLQGTALAIDLLVEAFKTGGGVPFEAYGPHLRNGIAMTNRPMLVHDLASKWIQAMPDVVEQLHKGGQVADVGCGTGWSSVCLARGFENITVVGIEPDEASVEQARELVHNEGLADRVRFFCGSIEDFTLDSAGLHARANEVKGFDLITAIECIHDLAYPVPALAKMREVLCDGGVVFVADEAAEASLEANKNPVGQFIYNVSVLHCLPQAMVHAGAAGTGTCMPTRTLARYAKEAGFADVKVLDVANPFFRFYRLD